MIRERKHLLVSNIKDLLNKEDKEQYLMKIAITKKKVLNFYRLDST